MHLLPTDNVLSRSFPEIKLIYYIRLAKKYLPPLIVALFVWQYYMRAELAITVITTLFALSLPAQGIFFLGKKALSPLPLTLLSWYNILQQQLIKIDVLSPEANKQASEINFIDFVQLLNLSKLHLGNYFGDSQDDNDAF